MTAPDAPIDLSPAALAELRSLCDRESIWSPLGHTFVRSRVPALIDAYTQLAADKDNALRLLETASDKVRELESDLSKVVTPAWDREIALQAEVARLRAENEKLRDRHDERTQTVASMCEEVDRLRAGALTAEEAKTMLDKAQWSFGVYSGQEYALIESVRVKLARIAQRPESP